MPGVRALLRPPPETATDHPGRHPGGFDWPAGVPLAQPGAVLVVAAAPAGTILSAERYAPTPATARFTVSGGPDGHRAVGFWAAVAGWPPAADWGDDLLHDRPPAADRLLRLLDALTDTPPADPTGALAAVRVSLPPGWQVLPAADTAVGGAAAGGAVLVPVFRTAEPVGAFVRVRQFGLATGDEILRPAQVVVSAGRPPTGVGELDALAGSAPGAGGEALRSMLADLRPAALAGNIQRGLVAVFSAYWDAAAEWGLVDPAGADRFREVLPDCMAAGNLSVFTPGGAFDHPVGWVEVSPTCRLVTGRITRVVCPGLLGEGGRLWRPARVEAE